MSSNCKEWKTPNEIIKLHRLKQKKKALQARISKKENEDENSTGTNLLPLANPQKRKNPFIKEHVETVNKKYKVNLEIENDDTIMQLLRPEDVPKKPIILEENALSKPILTLKPLDKERFASILKETNSDEEYEMKKISQHLPVDWSLKTRLRVLSKSPLPGTNLKPSQKASGFTSFVRCLDSSTSTSGIDTSLGTRFQQSTMYWQQPNIPWLSLFPRNSKNPTGLQLGEIEKESLFKDWTESFHGIFQLLRARQCPYFYICANSFTALFRAPGICGRTETHVLLTPTTRGLRALLKKEEIEFTMPLKKTSSLNNSTESNESVSMDCQKNTKADRNNDDDDDDDDDDEDDLEEEKWLESLGVDEKEIKKIHNSGIKSVKNKEMIEDFSDNSIILMEGVECQAFFNFLLNAKSTVSNIGRLAGIPPTILAPVAFPGATVKSLQMRPSKVRMDGVDYFSIELKGTILPHILHQLSILLSESRDTFSCTFTLNPGTIAFTKASQKLIENNLQLKENKSHHIFGKENLSDCGLSPEIIESLCRIHEDCISLMDKMYYNKDEGYAWS